MPHPEQSSEQLKAQPVILPIEHKEIDAKSLAHALLELVPLLPADKRKELAKEGTKLREQLDQTSHD